MAEQQQGIQQLGNYKLIKKLGEGGMGAVYLADDLALQRLVAVKVLSKKLSTDPDISARFRREAKAAGRLNHPNIVGAYAVGDHNGVLYYVMEFCDGESLESRLKREGKLPVAAAVDLMLQAAAGLLYAHQQKFVHRDIKPGNIVVTDEGVAKILDLGLSKNVGGAQSYNTVHGTTLGTPHYMSPEQVRGQEDIDHRADIYSLGCTFYHLLIGTPPYVSASPMVLVIAHMNQPFPDPLKARPDLPPAIAQIICKMTAKDRAERYQDCAALTRDLQAFKDGQPLASTTAPAPVAEKKPGTGPVPARHATGKSAAAQRTSRRLTAQPTENLAEPRKIPLGAVALVSGALMLAGILVGVSLSKRPPDDNASGEKNVAAKTVKSPETTPALTRPNESTTPETNVAAVKQPPATPALPPSVAKGTQDAEELALAEFEAIAKNAKLPKDERIAALEEFLNNHHDTVAASRARVLISELRPPKVTATPPPNLLEETAPDMAVAAVDRWKDAVDLLPLVDPARAYKVGEWDKDEQGLVAHHSSQRDLGATRIQLPYQPADEYDFRIDFTRLSGNCEVGQILPLPQNRKAGWVMGKEGQIFAFIGLIGTSADNPTARVIPNLIRNGQRYSSIVQVRKTGLKAYLNGRLICDHPTDYTTTAARPYWAVRDSRSLGLSSCTSKTLFHRIQVIDINGKGRSSAETGGAEAARPNEVDPSQQKAEKAITEEAARIGAQMLHEQLLADVFALLATHNTKGAEEKLQQARNNPKLAGLKAELELDAELARYPEAIAKAVRDGAALLADGRPIALQQGKETINVAKNKTYSFKAVKNDILYLNEERNGGRADRPLKLDALTADTRDDLLLLGQPGPEGQLLRGFLKLVELVAVKTPATAASSLEIRKILEPLAAAPATGPRAKHLLACLDAHERKKTAR